MPSCATTDTCSNNHHLPFPKGLVRLLSGSAAVGALPLGFQVKLGLVRGKYLPAGVHAAEASYVSSSSLSVFLGCYCAGSMVL